MAAFLAFFTWMTDKIVELRKSIRAELLPSHGEVMEVKVPKKTKKYSVTLHPPPAPEASDWAKFTAGFIIGLEMGVRAIVKAVTLLWGELKLLIVGSVLLWLFLVARAEWFIEWVQYDYGATQTFQLVVLFFSAFAFWRWIQNQSKWEPKLTGGRWIALALVGVTACLTVVTVFAIVHMEQLIRLLTFLRG